MLAFKSLNMYFVHVTHATHNHIPYIHIAQFPHKRLFDYHMRYIFEML